MSLPGEGPAGSLESEAGEMLALLWRTNHELALLSKRMIRSLGVTGPQRLVLRIIARSPGISASAVAAAAQLHASTLTGILDRLVRAGLLARARDSADLRRAQFVITAAAEAVVHARGGTVESAINRSIEGLSPDERVLVRRWLTAFADALAAESADVSDETL